MPYTLAHAAAALPLAPFCRRRLVFPALAVGTLLPDSEYFLRFEAHAVVTHSFWGVLAAGVPIGLVLLALWDSALRSVTELLLPEGVHRALRGGLPQASLFARFTLLSIVGSLVLGAATHFAWDAFTHADGWFVERVALFRATIPVLGRNMPLYAALQHGCSLLGLAALGLSFVAWARRAPRHEGPLPRLRPAFHAACLGLLLLVPATVGALRAAPHLAEGSPKGALAQLSMAMPATALVLAVAIALVVRAWPALLVTSVTAPAEAEAEPVAA